MAYTQKLRKPATFDHLRKKEPVTQTVEVVLSDASLKELAELEDELATLGAGTSAAETKRRKELLKEIEGTRLAIDDETVVLKFQAIGRKAYDVLVTDHQATDEQKTEAEANGLEANYNPETFPPALIAASCIEPKMTAEEVSVLFDEWNAAEIMPLFGAALAVNTVSRRLPNLSKDSGRTPSSGTS